jgi:hypothetical protein
MRFYTSADGVPSVWYDDEEIEQIVDGELDRAGLRPTLASPVIDIERFIESHLDVRIDQYADLPSEILGLTRFAPRVNPAIQINATLTDQADDDFSAPGTQGRWRATLAHEAAHVFLHRYLFDPEFIQSELPGVTGQLPRAGDVRCLNRDFDARTRDWREIQANKGMAALLMPRTIFRRLAYRHIDPERGQLTIGSPAVTALAADLAGVFRVSKQAAAIRLQTIGIATPAGVSTLPGM